MRRKSPIKNICAKVENLCYTSLKAREYFDLFILRILYLASGIGSWQSTYTMNLDPISSLWKWQLRTIHLEDQPTQADVYFHHYTCYL